MSEQKYADLLTTLKFKKGNGTEGGANAREVFIQGKQIKGFDLNFILGVYESVGDWAPGWGAHSHPFDELLVFFGYTPDMNYLGADMEFAMGIEREKHKYSVPTIVAAPKGIPHCPLVTEKVYQPYGHFHIALSGKYSKTQRHIAQQGETNGKKYSHLFNKMPIKNGPGGADARQLATLAGADLQGMNVNLMIGYFDKPGQWENKNGKKAYMHPYDEVMVFFSLDQTDLSHLGAEMTVEIGAEHEQYTFNQPTAIVLPKGTPHGPITCNKAERSYAVMQIGLAAEYKSEPV
jgi:hypothetical protein